MRDPPSDHQGKNSNGHRRSVYTEHRGLVSNEPGHWAKLDFEIQEVFLLDRVRPWASKLPPSPPLRHPFLTGYSLPPRWTLLLTWKTKHCAPDSPRQEAASGGKHPALTGHLR